MKIDLDITNIDLSDLSSPIDVYDGKTIFLDIPTRLPEKLTFDIWGAAINKNADWETYCSNKLEKKFEVGFDIAIVKGFGKFIFNNVIACNLKICPTTPKNEFVYNDGKIFTLKRFWNLEKSTKDCFRYFFDTNIFFPYGNCELEIFSKGDASFVFDTDDVVKYNDYLNDEIGNSFSGFTKDKTLGRFPSSSFE